MPAIVLLLIPILGEEATVALFISLCRFAMAAAPFFEALTENVGPTAPVRASAVRVIADGASSTFVSSGFRSAGSLITTAYERSAQYWRPNVGSHQLTTEQLREALQVVKNCGKSEQKVTELVRRAARYEHPPTVHPPSGALGNLVRASENVVIGNPQVSGFLYRNSVIVRRAPDSRLWKVFHRVGHLENPIGDIDVLHQSNPAWVISRITQLMTAARIVVH